MNDLVRIGSETAKGGFANEDKIAEKFNDWKRDEEAKKWLEIMGYKLNEVKEVKAIKIHGYKTDVQIKVLVFMKEATSIQNLSIKKANDDSDYNQTDKRWVRTYKKMWNIPEDITKILMMFCGELSPSQLLKEKKITKQKYNSLKDKRRFFLNEFDEKDRKKIVDFFTKHKIKIVADIIKGSDKFSADWMLVTKYNQSEDETTWILRDINYAMDIFGGGDIKISGRGSLYIGKITMQRKGGDAGRNTANMLQFKISPCDLFKN